MFLSYPDHRPFSPFVVISERMVCILSFFKINVYIYFHLKAFTQHLCSLAAGCKLLTFIGTREFCLLQWGDFRSSNVCFKLEYGFDLVFTMLSFGSLPHSTLLIQSGQWYHKLLGFKRDEATQWSIPI